jgi:hypothetical protein|tara:strand:- start:2093 stop:2506 length:414 start_codon:yes stop_codon:yes gene_type:complete
MSSLSFFQAKEIVSPHAYVIPGSHDHKQILELMRQSGTKLPENSINTKPTPLGRVKHLHELAPFRERVMANTAPKSVSKKEWLAIDANRIAFQEHMDSQPIEFPRADSLHIMDMKGKTFTGEVRHRMSKKEFCSLLK